jgi:undecaprenyl-diphosphatase
MIALPFLYGSRGLRVALIMLASGAAGLAVYKFLKRTFVRERPFIRHAGISLAQTPLDRYSFPSGHTLHAVAFAWQACAAFPELSFALVPLALAIAASRVVLGLHYPTDVLVGALLGAISGAIGVALQ